MIVYLDTSSLVKLYVEEEGSQAIAELVATSEVAATSLVAYAEGRSAFARRYREGAFSDDDYDRLVAGFNEDWGSFLTLKVSDKLVRLSGELADEHGLRGFDAIHLASAIILNDRVSSHVLFSCYDQKLQHASLEENLRRPQHS